MRLGLHVGYWGLGLTAEQQLELVREAESPGFDSVWAAEAYGSDAATVLAWLAAQTEKIKLGSAIFQMPGALAGDDGDDRGHDRQPLGRADAASGIGSSGPQVAEGWHGQRFAKQLQRTREYVGIVRKALARERLEFDGEHYTLPLPDGPGKALKLMIGAGAGADPDLHRRDRARRTRSSPARSPTAGCPTFFSPRARRRVARAARGGRGARRARHGSTTRSTSRRP